MVSLTSKKYVIFHLTSLVNYIASYRLPEEKEDYVLPPEEQKKRGLATPSNLRSFPAPLFTRYDLPMNYKYAVLFMKNNLSLLARSFKPNPSSIQQTIVDKETGETSTRLVHSSRLRMQTPVSIKWGEPVRLVPYTVTARNLSHRLLWTVAQSGRA